MSYRTQLINCHGNSASFPIYFWAIDSSDQMRKIGAPACGCGSYGVSGSWWAARNYGDTPIHDNAATSRNVPDCSTVEIPMQTMSTYGEHTLLRELQ